MGGIFHALPKELSHAGGGIWDLGLGADPPPPHTWMGL